MRIFQIIFLSLFLLSCSFIETTINKNNKRFIRTKSFPIIEKSRPILFVADNQFHNIYTDASVFGLRISDIVSRVAIRPAALNLYSPNLFSYILRNNQSRNVIHLGDALNVGCKSEWKEFVSVMDNSVLKQWVMAPGNHDFYFYGITSGGWLHDIFRSTWADGCIGHDPNDNQDRRFSKNQFLDEYIDHLKQKNIISSPQKTIEEVGLLQFNVEITRATNPSGFYRKVESHKYINYRKQRSFITQFVNLSTDEKYPTIGVILDTTNYHYEPTNIRGALGILSHNAGLHGYVDTNQLELIKQSLEGFKTGVDPLKVIFIGHHPLRSLNEEIQDYLFLLNKDTSFVFGGYISAHTHSGFTAMHKDNDGRELQEYNIGSVTDWPIEIAVSDGNLSKVETIQPSKLTFACDIQFDYSDSRVSNYTAYRMESHDLIKPGQKLVNAQHRFYIQTLIRAMVDLNVDTLPTINPIYKKLQQRLSPSESCGLFLARDCQDHNRKIIKEAVDILKSVGGIEEYAVCQALWSSRAEFLSYLGIHKEDKE